MSSQIQPCTSRSILVQSIHPRSTDVAFSFRPVSSHVDCTSLYFIALATQLRITFQRSSTNQRRSQRKILTFSWKNRLLLLTKVYVGLGDSFNEKENIYFLSSNIIDSDILLIHSRPIKSEGRPTQTKNPSRNIVAVGKYSAVQKHMWFAKRV